MTAEARLAEVVGILEARGVNLLVMGGHAVRHYGIDRNTVDFDVVVGIAEPAWDALPDLIAQAFPGAAEGPSWRPRDFRRFRIGALADGRDERLEFWRRNHLLADFPSLEARAERAPYGGAELRFLGIDDLVRSKETEREDDWRDVALLEEVADERRMSDPVAMARHVRSRRGFDVLRSRLDAPVIQDVSLEPLHPISAAFLRPYLPSTPRLTHAIAQVPELLEGPLREVGPASAKHLALVEAVRRIYRREAMSADRADKERSLR